MEILKRGIHWQVTQSRLPYSSIAAISSTSKTYLSNQQDKISSTCHDFWVFQVLDYLVLDFLNVSLRKTGSVLATSTNFVHVLLYNWKYVLGDWKLHVHRRFLSDTRNHLGDAHLIHFH